MPSDWRRTIRFSMATSAVPHVVCETFLILNGLRPTATEEEKYPVYLGLAAGEMDEDAFANWLRKNTAAVS